MRDFTVDGGGAIGDVKDVEGGSGGGGGRRRNGKESGNQPVAKKTRKVNIYLSFFLYL